jgi:hypothetical protein
MKTKRKYMKAGDILAITLLKKQSDSVKKQVDEAKEELALEKQRSSYYSPKIESAEVHKMRQSLDSVFNKKQMRFDESSGKEQSVV